MADSDNEYPNMEKIQELTPEKYLERLEIQIENSKFDKITSEVLIKIDTYLDNIKYWIDLTKQFIQKHVKSTETIDQQGQMYQALSSMINIHQIGAVQGNQSQKTTIIAELTQIMSQPAKECGKDNTYGGYICEQIVTIIGCLTQTLQTNKKLMTTLYEALCDYEKTADGNMSVTGTAMFQINMSFIQQAGCVVQKQDIGELFELAVKNENVAKISIYHSSASKLKDKFPGTIDKLLDILENKVTYEHYSQYFQLLTSASAVCPKQIAARIDIFETHIASAYKYYIAQIFKNVAKIYPEEIFALDDSIYEACTDEVNTGSIVAIYGVIGGNSKKSFTVKKCTERIIQVYNEVNLKPEYTVMIPLSLQDIANVEANREILKEKFIKKIEEMKSASQGSTAEQYTIAIDTIYGRNLKVLDQKIDDLKQEIIDYVNQKIGEIEKNYDESIKKLPMPIDIEVKKSIINTIFLKFECAYHKDTECEYPGSKQEEGEYFKTKTKEVNKWCKVGCSVFSLGKSVMGGDIVGALDALSSTFSAATSDNNQGQQHFKTLLEEPFLTSSEQDRLILQLREAKFFHYFNFSAQHKGWVCHTCKPFERKELEQKTGCKCTIF